MITGYIRGWLEDHGIYTGPAIILSSEILVKNKMEELDARKARYEDPTWTKGTILDHKIVQDTTING